MSNTVSKLTYPMSIQYRKNWGIQEAIRELVQNCLDEAGTYKTYRTDKGLAISDEGRGISIKHLLLGVTEKQDPDEARGKFGEGMKIAAVVLERLGYHLEIRSHDLFVKSGQELMEFPDGTSETVLSLTFTIMPELHNGTEFLLVGYAGPDCSENFIYEHDKRIMKSYLRSSILNAPGKLFVKHIYVSDLPDAMYGYDLWYVDLEESRHIAKEEDVQREIGEIWTSVGDVDLIKNLLIAKHTGQHYESKCPLKGTIYRTDAWKIAWEQTFGDRAVIATSDASAANAAWMRGKPIVLFGDMTEVLRSAGIQTDSEYVKAKMKFKMDNVPINSLDKEKRRLWVALGRTAREADFEGKLRLERIHDDNTNGVAKSGNIYLDIKLLDNPADAFGVLIHEITHVKEYAPDNTTKMIHAMQRTAGKILAVRYMKRRKR